MISAKAKSLIIVGVIAVAASVSTIRNSVSKVQDLPERPSRGFITRQAQKAKAAGKTTAVISGGRVDYDGTSSSTTADQLLSRYSVVVAEPITYRSYSVDEDSRIITWYKFQLLDTLSPAPPPSCNNCLEPKMPTELLPLQSDEFLVLKEGGAITTSDDVNVVMEEEGFPPFRLKQKYLLLIAKHDSGYAEVGAGPGGTFILRDDETVEPVNKRGGFASELIQKKLGNSLNTVRQKLRVRGTQDE